MIKEKPLSAKEKEDAVIKLLNEQDDVFHSNIYNSAGKGRQKQIRAQTKTIPLWAWMR